MCITGKRNTSYLACSEVEILSAMCSHHYFFMGHVSRHYTTLKSFALHVSKSCLYLLSLYTEDTTPQEALQRKALQTESVFQEHSFHVIRFQALSEHYLLQSQRQQLVHLECRRLHVLRDRNLIVRPLAHDFNRPKKTLNALVQILKQGYTYTFFEICCMSFTCPLAVQTAKNSFPLCFVNIFKGVELVQLA